MSRVLVTGGAGFIGSHLCEKLLARGDDVVCIDDLNDYYNPAFKCENILELKKKKTFTFYKADIRAPLDQIFATHNFELVIHLAARAGVRASIENPKLYAEVNVGGTTNLLECSRKFGVKRFIFASSSSVYGKNSHLPFSEKEPLNEPASPYAATKLSAELMCRTYHNLYGLSIACLRLFTVYGPRGRPDMAPYKFTEKILKEATIEIYGDGTSKRDYTFIDDIISGILAATEKRFAFEIINLGNNKPVELNQFVSLIEKLVGKKAIIQKLPEQRADVPITHADISKAKAILGWEPRTTIEEGMTRFVEWYLAKRAKSQ